MKKKISSVLAVSLIATNISPVINVFADEVITDKAKLIKKSVANQVKISPFNLNNYSEFENYNEKYRVSKDKIKSISNNGGQYSSSSIDKAIDNNMSTHWETGKQNTESFKNEVVVEFKDIESIDRIAYATRQDGARGKGFPTRFEIYASISGEDEDFKLMATGSHSVTGNMLQFKFDTITAKKFKFVFKEANQGWASASEFWFYREDNIINKMDKLFTNESKKQISPDFNTIEKLDAFDREASTHPLYNNIKEDIDNARIILENKALEFTQSKVSKFKSFNDERLVKYDELFKIPMNKVTSITTNGGNYASNVIQRAMDGDVNTNWHSGKQNTSSHTNEVVMTLDELTTIDRIMYTSLNSRGFAQSFDIYASRTSNGDTFEKITSGEANITKDTLEIKFKPTKLRRIKFVFKKGYENWALASEFGLYKQDELKEKIDRLFVNEDTNEVNPEFATIAAIEGLMKEVKGHPFENEYIEKLEIAKELVDYGKVQAGTSNVSKFTPFYTEYIKAYDDVYRIKDISISNNGGQYAGSAIKYAVDEDVNTHWETGKPNSDSFKNEVILTLEEATLINRLTYKSRNSGKGFAKEFSVYVSPVSSGNNFQKISEGGYTVTSDILEIQFDKTKAKRVKFVFDNAHDNWASISDIRLYKEDNVSDKMKRLFTNGLMDTVSEEFNTIEKLNTLSNEVKVHPLRPIYDKEIQLAKDILNNNLQNIKTVVAEQHGDRNKHTSKNLKFGFGNNNQPTGVVARAGEEVTVYVDADPNKPLPQLMFSQQEGSFANWGRTVSLHPGKNVITVPKVNQNDGWYKHDVTPGGPVYIVNPYTEEEQGKAPVIRFASGCDSFPLLDKNTNETQLIEFIKDYKNRLDEDAKENPNVLDRKMIDTFEFVSDHMVFTGTVTGAYDAYVTNGKKPLDTIKMWNDHMDMLFKYQGLDGKNEKNDIKYTRENIRLAQPFGYMYAAGGHIGVQGDVMSSMLTSVGSWGVDHEIGHKMDIGVRTIGEVTNNMLPQQSSYYYNSPNKRIPFESHTYKNIIGTDNNDYYEGEYFEKLAVFWQLEMIYPGYWAKLNTQYRENNVVLDSSNEALDKLNQLAKYSSIALELDLSEHFERHGFFVSDETKELISKYPKPDKKIWYSNYDYKDYKGEGFKGNIDLKVKNSSQGNNVKLIFEINKEAKNDLLGYEIFKGDKLIGFTSTNSFVDTNSNIGEAIDYTIVPYDKKLNTGNEVKINSLKPSINVQQKEINVKLREKFNPLSVVKAFSYNGEDISNKIKVNESVNVNEKGNYPVEYTVEDNGVTTKEVISVNVVSDYHYLSDSDWKSVQTQYGTPRRNTNIKGRVNGEIKDFDKGFGIHANGKITYDLSDKEYDNFEALLGVDMGITAQNNSSITFKVVGDGKTLATTKVLKHEDNMISINVPVKGIDELVIEVSDGGNGNTSDHTVIANPKLTTNNAKPTLNVEDKTYKLGDKLDLNEGVKATDAEDGDLTSSVEVVSNNFEEGKVGRFEVIYGVTDSDNNYVEKKWYITVYEDYIVAKSKYGSFENLDKYNEEFKIPVASVSNNAGNYGSSVVGKVIDENINTHWETNKPNSDSFKNEVIFDLGKNAEISKVAFAARRDASGKGFANKFEIYVSNEVQGNDFILAGIGEYNTRTTDVVEFDIAKTNARRVKFKFVEANQGWASLSEVSFYKEDVLANKIKNELFKDNSKTDISENYNTLEKVEALRNEVKNHPAYKLFEEDLLRAEKLIKDKVPVISFEDTTYVKLNSDFDLMSGVSASDQEDKNITSNIIVNDGGFNTGKAGEYTITYTVTDSDNNTVSKTRTIIVYSKEENISDLNWKSAVSGWKFVNKDSAVNTNNKIKLNVGGTIKEFDKGLGAATNAEIVYDLNGEYSNFTTYVGTDKNYNDNRTSIIFKIFADGKEVYTSDTIRKDSEADFVNISVKGVKELRLVADDSGNGGLGDFASWGSPKLYKTNSKPDLQIEKDIAVKLGESIDDVVGKYLATDAEDGDITSKVLVTGQDKVNFNKSGKYKITYSVTDLDGNKVDKVRNITVVDMNDFKYLTDYDWKVANQSYGSTKKDISASNNSLRLTKEDGGISTYERGIGAHANATITYDLTDKDYDFFSSYVGVDRAMYGTVGSVKFEVYVDGEKRFNSGVMNSRDPQKYVELSIAGAKELKLVVNDGSNGIGSDHATWGAAKLHFANNEKVSYEELESLVSKVNEYNKESYTEESFKVFEEVLNKANIMLKDKISSQEEINEMIKELNKAIENLEENVDLSEIVNIKDKYLKASIKKELNLSSDTITVGDMQKLTSLNVQGAESLNGLQYAKNLESLNIKYNEISDLSPLKDLKKLTDLRANPQIITAGSVAKKDNKVTIDYDVLNRKGEKLSPNLVTVRNNKTLEDTTLDLADCLDENGVISFDTTKFEGTVYSVYLGYEDTNDNYTSQVLFMFNNN
ncbi:NPCBM/NEW2 domain-containing protein [Paraclostridium tenue]|uniref:DUF5011 domain-containing protein n=1 Tax=Paraclostridium tenue TaxID=1737 RepID=A0ABP3XGG9_9FIRM